MNPEELKAYVDSALSQQNYRLLTTVGVVPLLTMVLSWLGAYLIERNKNAALKKDIISLTAGAETVKAFYSQQLDKTRNEFARELDTAKEKRDQEMEKFRNDFTRELNTAKGKHDQEMERLKSQLDARTHFGKTRYERELKVYEEIWPKLEGFRGAAKGLRPVVDTHTPNEKERDERRQARIEQYFQCQKNFVVSFLHSRPFFPQSVFDIMLELREMCWEEAVDFNWTDPKDFDWKKIMANGEAIDKKTEEIAEVIRKRLAQFDHGDG